MMAITTRQFDEGEAVKASAFQSTAPYLNEYLNQMSFTTIQRETESLSNNPVWSNGLVVGYAADAGRCGAHLLSPATAERRMSRGPGPGTERRRAPVPRERREQAFD